MRKLVIFIAVILSFASISLSGCMRKNQISRNKFIRVLSTDNMEEGVIEDTNNIEKFIDNLKMDEWKYVEREVPEKDIRTFEIFEKVDDEYIRKDSYFLFKDGDSYYISQENDVISIPDSTGKFLTSLNGVQINTSHTSEDILNKWELPIENQDFLEDETENENTLHRSNIKKIIALDKNGKKIKEISNKNEILKMINGINLYENNQIETMSEEVELVGSLIFYAVQDEQLSEMYRVELYKSNKYYLKEIIPENDKGNKEYIEYYTVPESIKSYFR
ncbi:MAG: hypothetical protein PHW34_04490 [Hespellia sp.]|nr:hypothetical protein [Hespellia sp.]